MNVHTYVSVTLGVDEHHIVATVVVSTVDKHCVEEIRGWVVFVHLLQERIQVQFAVKLKPTTQKTIIQVCDQRRPTTNKFQITAVSFNHVLWFQCFWSDK